MKVILTSHDFVGKLIVDVISNGILPDIPTQSVSIYLQREARKIFSWP